MQFLLYLHVALTCIFVLALTFVLFTLFSYLASSFINHSSAKRQKRRQAPAAPRSLENEAEWARPSAAVMDRLLEDERENEKEEDDGTLQGEAGASMVTRRPAYEFSDSIFYGESINEEPGRKRLYGMDAYEGINETPAYQRGELMRIPDSANNRWRGNESGNAGYWDLGEVVKGRLNGDEERKQVKSPFKDYSSSDSSSTRLLQPSGNSSGRQRLPPTWSDLEKLVNLNSKKDLLSELQPPLAE